jgi:hypothetical protein
VGNWNDGWLYQKALVEKDKDDVLELWQVHADHIANA